MYVVIKVWGRYVHAFRNSARDVDLVPVSKWYSL